MTTTPDPLPDAVLEEARTLAAMFPDSAAGRVAAPLVAEITRLRADIGRLETALAAARSYAQFTSRTIGGVL